MGAGVGLRVGVATRLKPAVSPEGWRCLMSRMRGMNAHEHGT
jgi:hypothetical protein